MAQGTQSRISRYAIPIAAVLVTAAALNAGFWALVFRYTTTMAEFEGQPGPTIVDWLIVAGAATLSALMVAAALLILVALIKGRTNGRVEGFAIAGLIAIPFSVIYFIVGNYLTLF